MVGKKPKVSSGPKIPQAPKPKSKGKKPAPPKFSVNPDVDKLDVFRVIMHSDAGEESSHSSAEVFNLFLTYLSRSELKEVDKKIRGQSKRLMKKLGNKASIVEEGYAEFKKTLNEYLEHSIQEELLLLERVEEKLEDLKIERVDWTEKNKISRLVVSGRTYSLDRFIRTFLKEELKHVETRLDEGKIIRKYKRQRPKRLIQEALEEALSQEPGFQDS